MESIRTFTLTLEGTSLLRLECDILTIRRLGIKRSAVSGVWAVMGLGFSFPTVPAFFFLDSTVSEFINEGG